MPFPVAAAITAGAQLGGAAINAFSQGKQNKKQRQFIRERYDVERADALSDWAMQNEYNSPRQQMQRLQEAGLNPHLVYGGSGNTGVAGQIKSTDSKSYNPQNPRPGDMLSGAAEGFLSGSLAHYDMKIKKAQADNLTAQNTNIMMDALLKEADLIAKKLTNTQRSEMDAKVRELYDQNPMLQKYLKDDLRTTAATNLSFAQEKEIQERTRRNNELHPGDLKIQLATIGEILSRTATSQKQRQEIQERIKNLQSDNRLKKLHIQMRENGIEPTDPQWQRIIIRAINGEGLLGKLTR